MFRKYSPIIEPSPDCFSVSTTASNTQNQSLQYVYAEDRLTEILTPNGKYRIIYDDWGQVRSVNVVVGSGQTENVIPLVEYTYNQGAKRTQVNTAVYKNSSTNRGEYRYEYYDNGTLKYVYLNGEKIHAVEYDNLVALESIENIGGRTVEYTDNGVNIYNAENVLVYTSITGADGLTTEENYGIKYKEHEPEYNYDSETGYSTNTTALDIAKYYRVEQAATTDWFGRETSHLTTIYDITRETETISAETIGKISTEYEYPVADDGKTSQTIEKYVNRTYNGSDESVRVFDGYYYEYDKQNKISAEKTLNADGTTTDKYSYEYDKLGQLVRFNDAVENKTYTYTYDNNGNILTKSEYAYTTGDLGTATNTTTYGYDTQWKDKLTTVGDKTIAYDNIGNPTSYLGATLTWEGRNLKSYETGEQKLQYQYDENGMRYRTTITNKEDNSVGYLDYVWVDSKLISISFTSDELNQTVKYLYNDFDEPVGFVSTREDGSVDTYYYLKNAQGDITNIVSAAGKKMVSFTYDVFGKRTVEYQANGSTNPGQIELLTQMKADLLNPFAYRGYCYDYDMGMYYLQSRYYDPNTGRFINADDTNYLNATGTVLGCNLFAYCENDPVNRVDETGYYYQYIGNAPSVYLIENTTYFFNVTITHYRNNLKIHSLSMFAIFEDNKIQISTSVPGLKNIINRKWIYHFARGLYRAAKHVNPLSLAGRTIEGIQFEILIHYIMYIGLKNKNNKSKQEEKDYKRVSLIDIGASTKVNGKRIGYDTNGKTFEQFKGYYSFFESKLFGNRYTAYALYKLAVAFGLS